MPFQSKSQAKWMMIHKPKMAKQWLNETPNLRSLPEHKRKMSSHKSIKNKK